MLKQFTNKIFILLLCILLIGWYIYLHPSKETMSCNSNLTCTVNRTFVGFINFKSEIQLNQTSYIYLKDHVRHCSRPSSGICTHVVHIFVSDKNWKLKPPFIYYYIAYDDTDSEKSAEIIMQNEISSFNEYIKKPENGFYIEPASGNLLLIYTIIGTIFVYIIYYIFNFVEKIIKKIFGKKAK